MRKLKNEELDLIIYMLRDVPNGDYFIKKLSSLLVTELNKGIGNLKFLSETSQKRTMQKEVAHINLLDVDGIPLSMTLNLGTDGELYELSVLKANASLIQFPLPPYNTEEFNGI